MQQMAGPLGLLSPMAISQLGAYGVYTQPRDLQVFPETVSDVSVSGLVHLLDDFFLIRLTPFQFPKSFVASHRDRAWYTLSQIQITFCRVRLEKIKQYTE